MLTIKDLDAYYGKSHILHKLSLEVADGEVIGILGRNGVGKTTALRAILGLTSPRRTGTILFDGTDISHLSTHKISRLGLGYVPQGRMIFPRLSVLENLIVPVISGKPDTSNLEEVYTYFPILKERLRQLGSTLSGGQQQMLAIGRAMMLRPKLMIIDEPTEGLQPSMVVTVRETIKELCHRGMTALIADQNLENILELCHRVYVIEKGVVQYEEKRANLSMALLHKYLGVAGRGECK